MPTFSNLLWKYYTIAPPDSSTYKLRFCLGADSVLDHSSPSTAISLLPSPYPPSSAVVIVYLSRLLGPISRPPARSRAPAIVMTSPVRRPFSAALLLSLITLLAALAASTTTAQPVHVISPGLDRDTPAVVVAVSDGSDDVRDPASAALAAMERMRRDMDALTDAALSSDPLSAQGGSAAAGMPDIDSVFDALLADTLAPLADAEAGDANPAVILLPTADPGIPVAVAAGAGQPRTVTRTIRGGTPDGGEFEKTTTTTTTHGPNGGSVITSTVYSSSSSSSPSLAGAGGAGALPSARTLSSRRHRFASASTAGASAAARRAASAASAPARPRTHGPAGARASVPHREHWAPGPNDGPVAQDIVAAFAQASSAIEKLARQTRLKQLEAGLEALEYEEIEEDAKGRPWPKGSGHAVAPRSAASQADKDTPDSKEAGGWEGGLPTDGPGALVTAADAEAAREGRNNEKMQLIGPDGKPLSNLKQLTIDTPGDGKDIEETIRATEERLGTRFKVRKVQHSSPKEHTHFHVEPDKLVDHGDHYHRSSEIDRNSIYLLLYMMGILAVSHYGFQWWHQKHPRSFEITMLFGMWITPLLIALSARLWRFPLTWLLFTAAVVRIVGLAAAPEGGVMKQSTPRKVYQWFYNMHRVCYTTAIVSSVLILLHLSGLPFLFASSFFGPFEGLNVGDAAAPGGHPVDAAAAAGLAGGRPPQPKLLTLLWFGDFGVYGLLYAMYFGVLVRDIAAVVTATIAAQIGYAPKELLPARKLLPRMLRKRIQKAAAAAQDGLRRRGRKGGDGGEEEEDDGASAAASGARHGGYDSESDDDDGATISGTSVPGEDKKPLIASSSKADSGSGSSSSSSERNRPASVASNTCAICDCALIPTAPTPAASAGAGAGGDAGAAPAPEGEAVFGLVCGHTFHESCLRGWRVVGKHDTCALCHEKCSISATLAVDQPWELQDSGWAVVLDIVRVLLMLNPVFFVMQWLLVFIY